MTYFNGLGRYQVAMDFYDYDITIFDVPRCVSLSYLLACLRDMMKQHHNTDLF